MHPFAGRSKGSAGGVVGSPPMATLEFFYDVGSPWTYLAFHRIEQVAAEVMPAMRS